VLFFIQNNTEELWTLLNFVDRDEFSNQDSFLRRYGNLKEAAQLESLQAQLKPYLLRRVKEHVERSVPPKEEMIIEVELTVAQKQYYRAIYEQNKSFLFRGGGARDGPRLTNLAMELRKCCNHPFLVRGAERALLDHFHKDNPIDVMVDSSGKLVLLDKLLPKLREGGHKVLIFSQFRMMLDILEDYLLLRRYLYERIDGAITGAKRQAAIDRFCVPDSPLFVMLLSTKAGGVGINLTPADTVIIFDSDWNPQNDIQAQARAHRIGQTRHVKVYRLLTRKTYEMHLFQVASMKLGLDYAVMHNLKSSMEPSGQKALVSTGQKHADSSDALGITTDATAADGSSGINMSKKEIESLLKHGAYDIFREESEGRSEEESRRFCDADIDQILERSTVVVHRGDAANGDEDQPAGGDPSSRATHSKNLGGALNSFSKASFVSSKESSNDVALDDPRFWEKVVGLSSSKRESDSEFEITDAGPVKKRRKRTCTTLVRSYNEDEARKIGGMQFKPLVGRGDGSESASPGEDSDSAADSDGDEGGRAGKMKRRRLSNKGAASFVTNTESSDRRAGFGGSAADKSSVDVSSVSPDVLHSITRAMLAHGFGQWDAIAEAVGAPLTESWTRGDVVLVCCLIVLEMFGSALVYSRDNRPPADGEPAPGRADHTDWRADYVKNVLKKVVCSRLFTVAYFSAFSQLVVGIAATTEALSAAEAFKYTIDRYTHLATKSMDKSSPPAERVRYALVEGMVAVQVEINKACLIALTPRVFEPHGIPVDVVPALGLAQSIKKLASILPPAFTGAKLARPHDLEALFDMFVSMKISEVARASNEPPPPIAARAGSAAVKADDGAALSPAAVSAVIAAAEGLVDWCADQAPTLDDLPDELHAWTEVHDAILIASFYEVSAC
jgi:hypothetical protein